MKELNAIENTYLDFASQLYAQSSLSFKDKALEALRSKGLPSKKDENWLYTNMQKNLPATLVTKQVENNTPNLLTGLSLQYAGVLHFCGENLIESQLCDSVEITEANEQDTQWLANTLEQDGLSALNLLSQKKIHKIVIKKNSQEKRPFVLHFQSLDLDQTGSHPLVIVEAQTGSESSFLEFHQGVDCDQFANTQIFFRLHSGAKLEHVGLFAKENAPRLISKRQVQLARDATYRQVDLNLGPKLARYETYVALNESGARAEVYGLYALQADQHADTFVQIHHHAPHSTSDQLFKGILSDHSRGIFTGKVTVHKDAQQVDSAQLNKNLLLGDKAHADTRPQLEVYADDVKCSHGATVGQIDQDEVFYLQSRGLDKDRALLVLCHAFGAEVLEKIESKELKKLLNQIFEKEYESNHFQKGQLS